MMLFEHGQRRLNKITDYFKRTKPWASSQPSTIREVAFQNHASSERGRMRPFPGDPSPQSLREDRLSSQSSKAATTAAPARRNSSVALSRRSRDHRGRSTSNGRASNAIALINKLQRREYKQIRDESVERRTLDLADFDHFLKRIRNNSNRDLPGYFDRELRYEYLAFEKQLVIHMPPKPVHSGLAFLLSSEIQTQLKDLNVDSGTEGDRRSLRTKASKILGLGDGSVVFPNHTDERSPDGTFSYEDCFEQKARNLLELGNGVIRTVVNIDLGQIYRAGLLNGVNTGGPAPATLSVYRVNPGSPTETTITDGRDVKNQVFRDANGEAVKSTELRLSLSDFVCERCDECKSVRELAGSKDEMIVISSEQLCRWYDFSMKQFLKSEAEKQSSQPRPEAAPSAEESIPNVQAPTPPADNQPRQSQWKRLRGRLQRSD